MAKFVWSLFFSIVLHTVLLLLANRTLSANLAAQELSTVLELKIVSSTLSKSDESEKSLSQSSSEREVDRQKPNDLPVANETNSIGIKNHFDANELSTQPSIIGSISLDPPEGYPLEQSGVIQVDVWVSASGDVDLVRVYSSFLWPKHRDFLATQFSKAKFHPGVRGNVAVPSHITFEVLIRSEGDNSARLVP